jgi:hypothetical protein
MDWQSLLKVRNEIRGVEEEIMTNEDMQKAMSFIREQQAHS